MLSRRLCFLLLPLAAVAGRGAAPATEPPVFQAGLQPNPALTQLETRVPDSAGDLRGFIGFSRQVAAFVETNQLETGDDFLRAAKLMSLLEYDYRTERVRYELLLTAIAKDNDDSAALLPEAWNSLLATLGRPLRLESSELAVPNPEAGETTLDPAPAVVQGVWKNPTQARADATKATDNTELQQLADAAVADRKISSDPTLEEVKARQTADQTRNHRAREIVTSGALHTAKDFANAALLLQHSLIFTGDELAHELAVGALLLGDRGLGRALVSATYDRMLNATGHDQRFATQYGPEGLLRVDEAGINDTERQAFGGPTLAEARKKR